MVYWPVQSFGGTNSVCTAGDPWEGFGVYPDLSILSTSSGQYGYDFAGLVPAIQTVLAATDIGSLPSGGNGVFPVTKVKDSIIYVHCDSGVNRTGAAIVSYLMKYGSNLSALGIDARPSSPYALAKAQAAANLEPPSNDTTPAGGDDLVVTIAYCNYLNSSPPITAGGPLCANAVPCICPYCPDNSGCS